MEISRNLRKLCENEREKLTENKTNLQQSPEIYKNAPKIGTFEHFLKLPLARILRNPWLVNCDAWIGAGESVNEWMGK